MGEKQSGLAPDRLADFDEEPDDGSLIVDAEHEDGAPLSEREVAFTGIEKR
jgi:hypothetical protein